jgi:hypothetical protein
MGLAHVVGTEASRHRFHTLAFPGQQQAGAIGLQWNYAIQVPRGLRQAIQIGREAFLLGAWRDRVGAHDPQLNIKEWLSGVLDRPRISFTLPQKLRSFKGLSLSQRSRGAPPARLSGGLG